MATEKDKQEVSKGSKEAREAEKSITIRLPHIPKLNPWMVTTFVLLAVSVILLIQPQITGQFVSGDGLLGGLAGGLTAQQAGSKAVEYINKNLVQAGNEATFVSSEEFTPTMYKVVTKYQGNDIDVYITKDGKWLFVSSPIDTAKIVTTTTTQPEEIPKSDKPKVELYVMSFCPYGNEAENTMFPVYNLLKDKVDWNIHYIVSVSGESIRSLHGQKEIDQNEREACVLKEYGLDKWWPFVTYVNENCGSDGSCWKDSAKEAGLDADKIGTCVEEEGSNLMKKEAETATSAGATGSPTLIINGVMSRAVYQYGNSESYKQTICSAFNSLPKECEQTLSSSGSSIEGQC